MIIKYFVIGLTKAVIEILEILSDLVFLDESPKSGDEYVFERVV